MPAPLAPAHVMFAASCLAGCGVALGAFGAHGLATIVGAESTQLDAWDTAVLYHLIHAVVMLCVGVVMQTNVKLAGRLSLVAVLLFAGIVLFSGSLYGLVLGAPNWLGPVTPLGGVSFIVAWVLLALSVKRVS